MIQDLDIAIIGAGAAGVGAARRLTGSGLSTLVLEALPRPGGRAWTRESAGLPLDLGCGWLHSADRNPWTRIAEQSGFAVDRRIPAWSAQYCDLGFPPAERAAAQQAFAAWSKRLATTPPLNDCAADALDPEGRWTAYLQAMSGFISGDELERISARDYAAYDMASTDCNWRVRAGYGTLVAASFPAGTRLCLATPVEAIALDASHVALHTPAGTLRVRAAILTVSTSILAGDRIVWPSVLDPWREAASHLPLGRDEKLFLEIVGKSPFAPESHVLGDPHDAATGTYYIRPFGWPVIECFLGGAGARAATAEGPDAAFARAIDQLVRLFGSTVRHNLKPLMASDWAGTVTIGGAYSHALPGWADTRAALARPFDGRLFFAGEATHTTDFSTAHGAYESGMRAAEEAIKALAPR
ncbi:flavin monoamine oxidase family protein [Beijerinckia indica]|uniref:Tryptophan 2-monooxygenase n=1 Tax=Beijerinckia indica subsp. indica (strain ATCC 9039 / DSM 1715 / NCIMB 8712) TaxID=395963 RepID=B2ICX6_BEII9|nr:NAD(P)/FAD-dependent oxidoreductase [Beijerinckia indica]ACB95397.1 amine oxidase [Beijerinckia indica subsp. indica ATCC 9039]